jgi:hypothetical protein
MVKINLNLMEKYKEMGYKVTGMVSMTKINYKIINIHQKYLNKQD